MSHIVPPDPQYESNWHNMGHLAANGKPSISSVDPIQLATMFGTKETNNFRGHKYVTRICTPKWPNGK